MSRVAAFCVCWFLVAFVVFFTLSKACEKDLRFCPGPVACQVWQ